MKSRLLAVAVVCALASLMAGAEVLDRVDGIKIGQRMTLRPYVTLSLSYDSNVPAQKDPEEDMQWTIAPGLGLTYNSENWSLLFSGYYNYRQYHKSEFQHYNNHNYGEDLRLNWTDTIGREKGWSIVLGESFRQVTAAEDLTLPDGQNYSGDSRQLQLSGVIERRFSERWHADANASYYMMDYIDSGSNRGYSYYGWDRWSLGAEAGFAPSQWTDILLSGAYMGYTQDNAEGYNLDNNSDGWTFQGGIGSYMTERISYRVLGGWSRFNYAGYEEARDGFVYTVSGNWKIGETWNTMLLATGFYQPGERQQASMSRVDSFSWGLAKVLVRGKLRLNADLRYRHETIESIVDSDLDYALDIVTGRIGATYFFNRIFSVFANVEYQRSFNDEADSPRYRGVYDYDRWRVTCGFRLAY